MIIREQNDKNKQIRDLEKRMDSSNNFKNLDHPTVEFKQIKRFPEPNGWIFMI